MGKSRRRSESESFWRLTIDQQRNSGLSVRQFCRGQRLSESSFHYWNRKLDSPQPDEHSPSGHAAAIVPVEVVNNDSVGDHGIVEIRTPAGMTLRCSASLGSQAIASVISAIESASRPADEDRSC